LTTTLIDEGIQLASAFQLAGYRQVVATLWEVNDLIAAGLPIPFTVASLKTPTSPTHSTEPSALSAMISPMLHPYGRRISTPVHKPIRP
jgi:CHAT domain